MKILSISNEKGVDLGEYGPACEGFIDSFKALFGKKKKGPFDENLKAVKGTQGYGVLVHKLEDDLRLTYDNSTWVNKEFAGASGLIQVKALAGANVDGKPITAPSEIMKVAQSMFVVVKDTFHRELPFIQKRKKLVEQIAQKKDPAYADQVWLDNQEWLKPTAADRFKQKYKGHLPALSNSPKEDGEWPISDKQKWNHVFSNAYPDHKTDGMFEAPSVKNAKAFADTIRGLVKMLIELNKMAAESRLPHWEFLEVEWDDLKYGPEIFDRIASADGWYEVSDLINGLADICYTLSLGLYIAMFDKHMISRQPANEGLFDWIKNGRKLRSNPDGDYKFDTARAFNNLKAFVASPDNFSLTGRNFTENDGLVLSLNGEPPRPDQLAHEFDKTVKSASKLEKRFARDARNQARICGPLITRFEKTMIDAMDREGNVDQAILDKAIEPIIAAKPQIQSTYFHTFGKEQGMCNSWLGGNPYKLVPVSKEDTSHFYNDYVKEVCVAVKAPDQQSLLELAKVLLQYSDEKLPFFKEGMFDENEDDWISYEFDRPVRHLADMMSDEQLSAINTLYSFESNTESLHLTVCSFMHKVYASCLKYIDMSITRSQVQ